MKFFRLLYYKYYLFQNKVGNTDVADIFPILMITFFFILYYFAILMVIPDIIFPDSKFTLGKSFGKITVIVFISFGLLMFYYFLFKKPRIKITDLEEEFKGSSNFLAILYPALSIVMLFGTFFLKYLQNEGWL